MTRLVVLLCVAIACAACNNQSDAAKTTASGSMSDGQSWVTYAPHPKLKHHPDSVQVVARRAAGFVDENEHDFLGSYVDDQGKIVVVAGTDKGVNLARKTFAGTDVIVQAATVTNVDVIHLGMELRRESSSLAKNLHGWGADPELRGMAIELQSLSDADRVAIEAFASKHKVPIRVTVVPLRNNGFADLVSKS